jgi:cytochrome P450
MEAHALFSALAKKVGSIELTGDPVWTPNNITRGPSSVPVRITAA